jgi:hypothetical protein
VQPAKWKKLKLKNVENIVLRDNLIIKTKETERQQRIWHGTQHNPSPKKSAESQISGHKNTIFPTEKKNIQTETFSPSFYFSTPSLLPAKLKLNWELSFRFVVFEI